MTVKNNYLSFTESLWGHIQFVHGGIPGLFTKQATIQIYAYVMQFTYLASPGVHRTQVSHYHIWYQAQTHHFLGAVYNLA